MQRTGLGRWIAQMGELPEFADEYTLKEKLRLAAFYASSGFAVIFAANTWLLPAISSFSGMVHCREILGVSGVKVLFYGLFVAMPLVFAFVVAATVGRHGYLVLKTGQSPLAAEKVFRPTRICRGVKARLLGYGQLLSPWLLVAVAVWGVPQARELSQLGQVAEKQCAPATIAQP